MRKETASFAAIVAVALVTVPVASAHNTQGVYEIFKVDYEHEGNVITGDIDQCDRLSEQIDNASTLFDGEDFCFQDREVDAFAVVGDGDVDVHVDCLFDLRDPDFANTVRATVQVDGYEEQTVCEESYDANAVQEVDQIGHGQFDVGDTEIVYDRWLDVDLTSTETGVITDVWTDISWVKNGLVDAVPVGTLEDPSQEDFYQNVTEAAATYEVADPSGDSVFKTGGIALGLDDGESTTVGDVKIIRESAPSISDEASLWTFEHTEDEPFLTRIQEETDQRITDVRTYKL